MEAIVRTFKPLTITPIDIEHLATAQHIMLQSLFTSGKRPRSKITCLDDQGGVITELTAGAQIQFLSSRLKQPHVEGHLIMVNTCVHPVWTTFAGMLKPNDEIEVVWLPDSHTTAKMLKVDINGDSVKLVCHRKDKQFHYLISVVITDDKSNRPLKPLTRPVWKQELNDYKDMGSSGDAA